MTSPIQSFQNQSGERLYTGLDRAGRYESVTTILKALPKPNLVAWAGREAAGVAVELMRDLLDDEDPLVPWISGDGDYPENVDWESLEDDIAKAHELSRDAGSDLGSFVHDVAEGLLRTSRGNARIFDAMLQDKADELPEEVMLRLSGLRDFLRDNELVVINNEFTLYNDTIGYAGQCDLAAWVRLPSWSRPRPFFLDLKTNKSVFNDIALQIAAYAHGEYVVVSDEFDKHRFRINMPFTGELGEFEGTPYGGILHVTSAGTKLYEVDISDSMFDAFCALALVRKLWYNGVAKETKLVQLYPEPKKKGAK